MRLIEYLGYTRAVKAFKDAPTVHVKIGTYGRYTTMSNAKAEKEVMASVYGANVYKNHKGEYFVVIPEPGDDFY